MKQKHFYHANFYPPPPQKRTWRNGRLARFVLTLLLVLVSGASWAGQHFYELDHAVWHHPTVSEPYINIYLCIYDTNGKDGFFMHNATYGGKAGPAIYMDGQYLCSPDWELAWPGSGDGNDDGLEDERGVSGWWGSAYNTGDINGTKYTVRFWDPRKANGKYYVLLCIDMNNMELGKSHTVKVEGVWRINKGTTQKESKEFHINPVTIPNWHSIDIHRTNYNTMDANGTLLSQYGPTNVAAMAPTKKSSDLPTKWADPSSFPYSKGFDKGTTTWNGMPMAYDDTNEMEYGPRYVRYQHSFGVSPSGRSYCTLWDWGQAVLPDFVRPKKITAEADIWKKQITLTWEDEDGTNLCKEGTWSIYRYPKGQSSASKVIADKLSAKTHKYVDDIPEYDADYVYEVAFIPTDLPAGKRVERLVGSITTQAKREFSIKNLDIDPVKTNDKNITINWECEEFKGNENYAFKILRADGDTINWEEIGTVSVV